ncbi:MAG: DNA (cytosine-5-)-methyltransferase [Gammaproteobacteria bacterium HGW-Gammaproteobacteria-1]|jgi:DNA (cytosine-5)-methyltransferase 1|nr:MAG: DNA (cytosine-5-)-methyltransferase [Gammaproteobacteria bacterium HGW-Gammaproteobacteria-1]
MIGIDIFAGAGGLSVGAGLAGIDVRIAVESDPHAAATFAHNHTETKVICKDIRKVKELSFGNRNHEPVIVFGGPPCQGFSTSNQKTRNSENPNNWLFREFIRIVRLVRPEWVVFENVRGILETEGGFFVSKLAEEFQRLGYTSSYFVLNAADYGVPQKRNRFFFVANLNGISVQPPEPTIKSHVTVKQALSDLPELANGALVNTLPYKHNNPSRYARQLRGEQIVSSNHYVTKNAPHIVDRFRYVPQGGNWADIPDQLMRNYKDRSRCHTGIYHRLADNSPSVVIGNYRKNMLIHPICDRGLSVREAARLQSFPDWFEFQGSIGFQQQQVGNAVPPFLAKAVFEQIINAG